MSRNLKLIQYLSYLGGDPRPNYRIADPGKGDPGKGDSKHANSTHTKGKRKTMKKKHKNVEHKMRPLV